MSGLFKRAKKLLGTPAAPKSLEPKRPTKPWHAVSIAPGPQACAAARDLVRRRYLSREAPALPLKACDQAKCACRYNHHDDRRKGPRRASEVGISVDRYEGRDKRVNPQRGRRKTDPED